MPSSWTCTERVENDLKCTVYLYAAHCVGHHSSVSVTAVRLFLCFFHANVSTRQRQLKCKANIECRKLVFFFSIAICVCSFLFIINNYVTWDLSKFISFLILISYLLFYKCDGIDFDSRLLKISSSDSQSLKYFYQMEKPR